MVSSICALIWLTRASMSAFLPAPLTIVVFSLSIVHHLLGATEHGERNVLHLDAEIFRDRLAAGQNCDILQHGLAAIAEARSLDGLRPSARAETVDDQGSERLAFDVFRDNHRSGLPLLHHGFQQRK